MQREDGHINHPRQKVERKKEMKRQDALIFNLVVDKRNQMSNHNDIVGTKEL